MRTRWRIALIWACFVARLAFYSAALPLWEGYDEWAHFAVIRAMAMGAGPLVARQSHLPRDVETSLELAPVPWELRNLPPPSVTQDLYWTLAPEGRAQREARFRAMPAAARLEPGTGPLTAYEALQPPLYYWMMAPAMRALQNAGLATQVVALRWIGSLIASLVIPLIFHIGRLLWDDENLALGCAAIPAVMPGLALDVARVGNECVAVVLFTLLTWLLLKAVRRGLSYRLAASIATALGFGLLAKAYFLTALPAVAWLLAWEFRRARGGRSKVASCALLVGLGSLLIAGWWYAHNLRTTGTLSGLSEAVILRGAGPWALLRGAVTVSWPKALDSVLFSHLYFGGWSSLMVRSWMYHLFYAAIVLAAIGLFRLLRRPAVLCLLAVYLAFWAGQAYNVVLLYLSKGVATSMGWYLYAVVGAEVSLATAGLTVVAPAKAGRWVAAAGVALFASLDLYAMHGIAIPYYTGMIRHQGTGALASLHRAGWDAVGWGSAVTRLTVFKAPLVSPALVISLWIAYLAGTVALAVAAYAWRPQREISAADR